jgi:omega-amidase
MLINLKQDMSKMNVSVIQMDIVWENPEENLKNISKYVLAKPGVDIFVLPEMFNTGFTNNTAEFAEAENGCTLSKIKELARISGAAICGSIILKQAENIYNTFIFVKPEGNVTMYNKRHLFAYGGETEMFTKGEERVVLEYLGFKIILLICYDLRFPVWSRNNDDYDLMIYVANWPATRRQVHDVLIRARAIENQSFVIACNRVGVDGKNISYNGGSAIINYRGDVIVSAKDGAIDQIFGELDLNELAEYKKSFPAHLDRDSFILQ